MTNVIVDAMKKVVKVMPSPAVYISGGIDSCIVLHHIREKFDGEIMTITALFGNQNDKEERVREISSIYKTNHFFVEIQDFVVHLKHCMFNMPFKEPRYNIWPYYLAMKAGTLGCENVYIGEGSDEVFGGYADRDYLTAWAGQLIYVRPTFDVIHNYFDLKLHAPFSQLSWAYHYQFNYRPPNKTGLREAYKDIIPEFVREAPASPPAFTNYFDTWKKELRDYVEFDKPEAELTIQDIKDSLQLLATDAWCKARKMKLKGGD